MPTTYRSIEQISHTRVTAANAGSRKCLIRLVGARGFEPPTSRSRTERSTRLSHAPTSEWIIGKATPGVKPHNRTERSSAGCWNQPRYKRRQYEGWLKRGAVSLSG